MLSPVEIEPTSLRLRSELTTNSRGTYSALVICVSADTSTLDHPTTCCQTGGWVAPLDNHNAVGTVGFEPTMNLISTEVLSLQHVPFCYAPISRFPCHFTILPYCFYSVKPLYNFFGSIYRCRYEHQFRKLLANLLLYHARHG